MNKDRKGNPLSSDAKDSLNWNTFGLIAFFVFAIAAAFGLDSILERTPIYDNLYQDHVELLYHTGQEEPARLTVQDGNVWGDTWKSGYDYEADRSFHIHGGKKIYGPHAYGVEIIDGHFAAHESQKVYDYGPEVRKGKLHPPTEVAALKGYTFLFMALLLLTPLGPQHFFSRRRQYLAEAEEDFTDNQILVNGRLGVEDIFAAEQGIAEAPVEGAWRPVTSYLDANKRGYDGESIADLNQISAMIWFTNGEKTIRVKVENDRSVRTRVAQAVNGWLGVRSVKTHVGATLAKFYETRDGIRPTTVVNEILTDLGKPLDERRPVKLFGAYQADDLLLATGLGIEGAAGEEAQQIVLPTGFIAGVIADMRLITGDHLPKPWYIGGGEPKKIAA